MDGGSGCAQVRMRSQMCFPFTDWRHSRFDKFSIMRWMGRADTSCVHSQWWFHAWDVSFWWSVLLGSIWTSSKVFPIIGKTLWRRLTLHERRVYWQLYDLSSKCMSHRCAGTDRKLSWIKSIGVVKLCAGVPEVIVCFREEMKTQWTIASFDSMKNCNHVRTFSCPSTGAQLLQLESGNSIPMSKPWWHQRGASHPTRWPQTVGNRLGGQTVVRGANLFWRRWRRLKESARNEVKSSTPTPCARGPKLPPGLLVWDPLSQKLRLHDVGIGFPTASSSDARPTPVMSLTILAWFHPSSPVPPTPKPRTWRRFLSKMERLRMRLRRNWLFHAMRPTWLQGWGRLENDTQGSHVWSTFCCCGRMSCWSRRDQSALQKSMWPVWRSCGCVSLWRLVLDG